MKSLQPRRKFWLGFSILVILFSISCSLGRTAQRLIQIVQSEKPDEQTGQQPSDFEGAYDCQEQHGQTFPGSLDLPGQPGLETSLANEDLEFWFSIGSIQVDGEQSPFYSFQYQCTSHILTPLFFYHDRKVTDVGQIDTYLVQKTNANEGVIAKDGWFSGSWVEEQNEEVPSRNSVTNLALTWHYIGVLDLSAGSPHILICSSDNPLDLAAAKARGVEGFAEFCQDQNYIVCTRDVPD